MLPGFLFCNWQEDWGGFVSDIQVGGEGSPDGGKVHLAKLLHSNSWDDWGLGTTLELVTACMYVCCMCFNSNITSVGCSPTKITFQIHTCTCTHTHTHTHTHTCTHEHTCIQSYSNRLLHVSLVINLSYAHFPFLHSWTEDLSWERLAHHVSEMHQV